MASVTAKIRLTTKEEPGGGGPDTATLHFGPDYGPSGTEKNQEWAAATPALNLTMTVKGSVAEQFQQGDTFTLTFDKE